jgi:hypothetical protein
LYGLRRLIGHHEFRLGSGAIEATLMGLIWRDVRRSWALARGVVGVLSSRLMNRFAIWE